MEGIDRPMILEIRGAPGSYQISYGIQDRVNKKPCIVTLNVNERRLVWRPSCSPPSNSYRFTVDFAASFTSLTGLETDELDPEIKYPITMQRQ
jgi:hypothetical protein